MGTHPIFESDFDCLTDLKRIKSTMSYAAGAKILKDAGETCTDVETNLSRNSTSRQPRSSRLAAAERRLRSLCPFHKSRRGKRSNKRLSESSRRSFPANTS